MTTLTCGFVRQRSRHNHRRSHGHAGRESGSSSTCGQFAKANSPRAATATPVHLLCLLMNSSRKTNSNYKTKHNCNQVLRCWYSNSKFNLPDELFAADCADLHGVKDKNPRNPHNPQRNSLQLGSKRSKFGIAGVGRSNLKSTKNSFKFETAKCSNYPLNFFPTSGMIIPTRFLESQSAS